MVLVASMEPAASVLGTPPADMLLKIVGTARDGQVVRLTNRKCSIGSAANCTLRLRARGVRPVHCLLLRGPGGTVLRSWAPGTRVNGEIVSDAELQAGDLVSIGPIEFEVLPSEGPPLDPFDAGRTVVLDRRPANRQAADEIATRSLLAPLAADEPGLEPTNKSSQPSAWHARVRRLVSEVRKLRDQIDRFQQTAPVAEEHAAEAAQLRERLETMQQQKAAWESTLERLQAELDDRQNRLAGELAALEASRTEFEIARRKWQVEVEAERQSSAKREAAQAESERTQQQAHEQWSREHANRTAELDRREAELDARGRELDARETELVSAEAAVRQTEQELAGLRTSLESQRVAASEELAAAHEELLAMQADCAAARERMAWENKLLVANRDELAKDGSRLADFEAELIAARQAIAALHETEAQRIGERTAELERLAAELATREQELAERLQAASEANTDTVIAQPAADHLAELHSLRQELLARGEELALAQAALQQANESVRQQTMAREAAELAQAQALAARQNEHDAEQAERDQRLAEREAELAALVAQHQQAQAELEQAQNELQIKALRLAEREANPAEKLPPGGELAPVDPSEVAAMSAQRDAILAAESELEREREELRAEREALRLERESFAHERLRAADRLDIEARELAEAREQLDAEREEFESRASGPAARWAAPTYDDVVEDDDEPPRLSEFSPDRRGRPLRPDDLETERVVSSDTLRSRPMAEEDDSIESHIAAFMDRLRSGQPVTPPVIERTLPKRRKCDEKPTPPPAEPVGSAPQLPTPPLLDMTTAPMEVVRRKAPEEKSSMNILREIGLSHARSAIDTHGQRRTLNQAYTTLAISAACLAVAFFVLFISHSAVIRSAGVVVLVVGIYWMGSSIWAVNKVVATIRRRRKGGLRAMLDEVDAEIAAIRKEAEAELAAAEQEKLAEKAAIAE